MKNRTISFERQLELGDGISRNTRSRTAHTLNGIVDIAGESIEWSLTATGKVIGHGIRGIAKGIRGLFRS